MKITIRVPISFTVEDYKNLEIKSDVSEEVFNLTDTSIEDIIFDKSLDMANKTKVVKDRKKLLKNKAEKMWQKIKDVAIEYNVNELDLLGEIDIEGIFC